MTVDLWLDIVCQCVGENGVQKVKSTKEQIKCKKPVFIYEKNKISEQFKVITETRGGETNSKKSPRVNK